MAHLKSATFTNRKGKTHVVPTAGFQTNKGALNAFFGKGNRKRVKRKGFDSIEEAEAHGKALSKTFDTHNQPDPRVRLSREKRTEIQKHKAHGKHNSLLNALKKRKKVKAIEKGTTRQSIRG